MKKYRYICLLMACAPSMHGMYLLCGDYCLELKDEQRTKIIKTLMEDDSCDICTKEKADALWYSRRAFAHQACIEQIKPYEKIFNKVASSKGFEKGTALYALSHARTFGAIQCAFRPCEISLLQYSENHQSELKKHVEQLAPFYIAVTLASRELPDWPLYRSLVMVKEKKESSKVLRLSNSLRNLLRSDKKEEKPLALQTQKQAPVEQKKEKEKVNE